MSKVSFTSDFNYLHWLCFIESCFSLWAKRLLPQKCIVLNICKQLTDLWHSSWDSCIIHHSFIKHSLRIRCRVRLWEYSSVSALRVSFLKKTTITIGSFNTVLISVPPQAEHLTQIWDTRWLPQCCDSSDRARSAVLPRSAAGGEGHSRKSTCTRPVVGGSTSLQEALQLQGLEQRLQREMTKKGNCAFVCTKLDRTQRRSS